ncbi:MAG: indole-3-glycerol-phosphate synthase [Spirochaetia bacterium]|nr:indole-3-glycerol-phosphate synthase [Spirochaetia bacterium]
MVLNQTPEPDAEAMNTATAGSLLDRIVETKRREVDLIPDFELSTGGSPARSLYHALVRPRGTVLRVIAECKKASPSLGLLRADYHPGTIASEYARLGAAAVSVLTDQDFFQGSLEHLRTARAAGIPVLRKDFIISPRQIFEAREAGADAFLLIVRLLDKVHLKDFLDIGRSLGMDAIVEIHSEREMETALEADASIIGINHRDLDTLVMDLSLTEKLAPKIRAAAPSTLIVAESGVESREGRLRVDPHADAVLIGTAFMKAHDIATEWRQLFG